MYVKFKVFLHTKRICKKCHISEFLAEVGFSNSKAYSKTTHSIEEITHANVNYYKKFELNITELDKLDKLCTDYLTCQRHALVPDLL